jgi:diacylglycerol kinase (ATP)
MRYAIITNPASGTMTVDQKRSALTKAAQILDAEIHGLDTTTADDLLQCAREIASRCDVAVIAGGDGTFSDIINAIDIAQTPLGFLPFGTGNAMQHALGYKGNLTDIAMRIRVGDIHDYDLIDCDGKRRAFTASVGLEGTIVRFWDQYCAEGCSGFKTYIRAFLKSYFRDYKRTTAKITVDDATVEVKNLLSLIVVKQPYYGFGMKVVPRARFDDGQLHILCNNSGFFKTLIGVATSFTIGNRIGQYHTTRQMTAQLDRTLLLQIDGNAGWDANAFTFKVLPKVLKIKC